MSAKSDALCFCVCDTMCVIVRVTLYVSACMYVDMYITKTQPHTSQHTHTNRNISQCSVICILCIYRSVHHGVDSGKKFLKFDFTLEFKPDTLAPSSSTVPDHGRRRVCLMAILHHVPESIEMFRFVYEALDIQTEQYFFQFHVDFKAITIATSTIPDMLWGGVL